MTTNKTPKITWSEPPETVGPQKYRYFWEALREHPGRWAQYPGSANAARINLNGRRDGTYECTTRTIDGQRVAFVRYIGNGSA